MAQKKSFRKILNYLTVKPFTSFKDIYDLLIRLMALAFSLLLMNSLFTENKEFNNNIEKITSAIVKSFKTIKGTSSWQNFGDGLAVTSVFVALLAATQVVYSRLSKNVNATDATIERLKIQNKIMKLELEDLLNKALVENEKNTPSERSERVDKITDKQRRIIEDSKSAFLVTNKNEKYEVDIDSKESIHQILMSEFDTSRNRLLNEIKRLEQRGLLNLVIGGVTTLLAISILLIGVLSNNPEVIDIKGIMRYYAPKITFSVFAEIFAFFFFRLYRTTLIDIKYYQNELTNIEMKAVSLKTLSLQGTSESFFQVCVDISKTERNATIKEAENLNTTVLLKNENARDRQFGDILQAVVEKFNKTENKKE